MNNECENKDEDERIKPLPGCVAIRTTRAPDNVANSVSLNC
jgi:hypothetical protein